MLDNLSTHTPGALYETFPAPEARRILRRLEFHHTPEHAAWLNMVEIEIGVLRGQCLDRRIGERDTLETQIAAWQMRRNASGARISWKFTTEKSRTKLGRAYPDTTKESKPTDGLLVLRAATVRYAPENHLNIETTWRERPFQRAGSV